MAFSFLTSKEREHYQRIPKNMEESSLLKYFFLNKSDHALINSFNGHQTKVAIGLQIGIIRFLGYLVDDWNLHINSDCLTFILQQLKIDDLSSTQLSQYGSRPATRTQHLQQILRHLNYRRWQPLIDEPIIEKWLIERGMEHDNERWLLEKLCLKLQFDEILRPSIGTLERIVGGIDERLHEETHKRLSFLWTDDVLKRLDALLDFDTVKKQTLHRWLCTAPNANTARVINQTIEKKVFLQELKIDSWDLSMIPANRRKRLTYIARHNTNSYLQRLNPIKRYSLLVCFLGETLLDITDSILLMYNEFWQQAMNDAKKAMDLYHLGLVKSQGKAISILTKATEMVVNDSISNQDLRPTIFENLSKEELEDALNIILKITHKHPLTSNSQLSFLVSQYARFKQFTINFLKAVSFEIAFSKDNFGPGLALVIDLQTSKKRKFPDDAPTNFITQSWQKIINLHQTNQTQAYELCVLSVLKDRLQSGDVFDYASQLKLP